MAHPQSNFTSTFNGTPLGNAKLTLSVNGVDHEYTPSGNDQTVDINGNEVVHIDDPDFVQLLNIADADKCELIIKQDITADGAYRKYRLADCHVLNGDREWRFTCTAGNIEYILTVTEDGSVTPSQKLIPDASNDLPLEDSVASAGVSNEYSRKDHVHPSDSTKEDKNNKVSYIDPTINQASNYLGGSAVNGFVEKRTFAISIPYGTTNSNTFTKILEFDETFDGSRTRGAIFARLKIQFIGTSIRHRLREIDVYIGYELNGKKAFVTFGNCYNTLKGNDLKKLHIVTYDADARCHVEVYLEHRELTAMTNWISVELCENFQILEQSWTLTQSSHSTWKIPLANYDWDEVNGASVQPTAAALPTTGVLKTDSYIIQSGNQTPFTYVPTDVTSSIMTIAKLAKNSGDTRLVFKLYSSEGWVAIGKVKRVNSSFTLNFSAIADKPDFNNGFAMPYIYLSLLGGVYFVNVKIDSYHNVAGSIAIEVENMNKDWEFLGSSIPDSIGDTVSDTNTDMKADLTAEVIDQGINVPAPTSITKVLTKQVDSTGREFWKTVPMSNIPVDAQGLKVIEIGSEPIDLNSLIDVDTVTCYYWTEQNDSNISNAPRDDNGWLVVYPGDGEAKQVVYDRHFNNTYSRYYDGNNFTAWTADCNAVMLPYSDTPSYVLLGRLPAGSTAVNKVTFLCINPGRGDSSQCSTYLVECDNRNNARQVVYTLLSPAFFTYSDQSPVKFGHIYNNDGSVDIVVSRPNNYSSGSITVLSETLFIKLPPIVISGTGFVPGSGYRVTTTPI